MFSFLCSFAVEHDLVYAVDARCSLPASIWYNFVRIEKKLHQHSFFLQEKKSGVFLYYGVKESKNRKEIPIMKSNSVKKQTAKALANVSLKLGKMSADSACCFIYHQPTMPEALKKMKKDWYETIVGKIDRICCQIRCDFGGIICSIPIWISNRTWDVMLSYCQSFHSCISAYDFRICSIYRNFYDAKNLCWWDSFV